MVTSEGENLGVISLQTALAEAQKRGFDLIEISPSAVPPVAKIMDYGKYKYEEKKKQQVAKKNQQVQELKELTFRPNTDENDLNHKLEQAKGFLEDGHRVKFTIRFRGREIVHQNIGRDKLNYIIKQLEGLITANPATSLEGKFLSMIVSPTKKQ